MARWQEIAVSAQKHRDRTIDNVTPPLPPLPPIISHNVTDVPRQLLSEDEIQITETPASDLIQLLARGEIKAAIVAMAFLRRAALAQKLVNCVHELLPERALARAKELDDYFQKENKPVGPLHGLPISVKARIPMKGLRKDAGFVADFEEFDQSDAELLKIFWNAGALFYVRTTEPQGLMMLETTSCLLGTTTNPHNTATTCGGSTGGDAALQALYGSPLGIGGDGGGSIRAPAGNCGLYALKPTANRVPLRGSAYYMTGCDTFVPSAGLMSPTIDGVSILMKIALGLEPWKNDLSLHQMPWRDTENYFIRDGKLQINVGVVRDDRVVKPAKSIHRALSEVIEKLKPLEGFTITEWEPYQHERGIKMLEKLYSPDGGKSVLENCAKTGEPVHPLTSYRMVDGPGVEELSLHEVWKWTNEREKYRYEYLQEWNSKAPEMDVILCPYQQSSAPVLETTHYWGYASIWNLLDYPACVFPVGRVNAKLDLEDEAYEPRSEIDKWCQDHYDAYKQRDSPVSLQLVGKKMDDEKVMQALEIIKQATGLPFEDCLAGPARSQHTS